MKNLRKHGKTPYKFAVIHGGPGAPGEMKPVARELSSLGSVLEPLQTETTLEGQITELKTILEKHGKLPIILIGFSWGAILSYIVAALSPQIVKKLILIGSSPFEEKYSANIMKTRVSRLGNKDLEKFLYLTEVLNNPSAQKKDEALCSFGKLMSKADAYSALPQKDEILECRHEIFKGVWEEASELRRSGKLLELGKNTSFQVIALHGDHDPHPFEGVREPLSEVLKNFKFILLKNCGHRPWIEREAKEEFYEILKQEIQ